MEKEKIEFGFGWNLGENFGLIGLKE